MSSITRRRLLAHPATIALASAGSSVAELAQALGVTTAATSHYLAGRRGLPEGFLAALAGLVGTRAAAEIRALIPGETPAA